MTDQRTEPPIRWAGIVGGAILALAAIVGLVVIAIPDIASRINEAVSPLLLRAEPGWMGAVLLMALGVAIVIGGIAVALRRRTPADDTPAE